MIENTKFKKEGCTINFCILQGKTYIYQMLVILNV